MKARCKKELTFDGYKFEVDKEYDFECKVIYLPAEKPDCVLARGNRSRHLQYSTKIEATWTSCLHRTEKVPMTLYFYDRQYCINRDWHSEGVGIFHVNGGQLLCFEEFFVESNMDDCVKNLRTIGKLPTHEEFWQKMMNNPLPRRFPNEIIDDIDVRYHASCGQQKRGGIDWNEMTHGEPESHYKGEGKKAVSEVETSLIRRYRNGYEAHYIDRTLHGKTYRMDGNPTGLVALPEEKIMLLTRDWTVVVFLEDLADLNRIECELNLHRIEEK